MSPLMQNVGTLLLLIVLTLSLLLAIGGGGWDRLVVAGDSRISPISPVSPIFIPYVIGQDTGEATSQSVAWRAVRAVADPSLRHRNHMPLIWY